ncbi:MAG TPA: GNAT family N-acetyltransferase [Longimicrobiales bacterium]|nr:GNAT family N-acetyltransferase [Longimicrobiales bacterium]
MESKLRPPDEIATSRLRLRVPTLADAPVIFERWTQDPDVTRYLVWMPHRNVDESKSHIRRCLAGWESGKSFTWFIETLTTQSLVGSIAARDQPHGINLGYLLARNAWGKGYMAEAVDAVAAWFLSQPTVERVWATCDVENAASARVLAKAGFDLEGTLRRWDVHPNLGEKRRDALCYSRIRDGS